MYIGPLYTFIQNEVITNIKETYFYIRNTEFSYWREGKKNALSIHLLPKNKNPTTSNPIINSHRLFSPSFFHNNTLLSF